MRPTARGTTTRGVTARGAAAGTAVAAGLLACLIGGLVVVPTAVLAHASAAGGLNAVWQALGGPDGRTAVEHTVAVACAVTVVSVAAGTALALAIERHRSRRLLRLLVAGPVVIPEFVLGFAWSQAYGPAGMTDRLAGVTFPGLFGPAGIVCALAAHEIPLAYLLVTAGLAARADPAMERAARSAGAGPWTTLRTVTLPLLRAPMLAAAALVFVTTVGSFAIPEVLGTPAGFGTMSTLVYTELDLSAGPAAFTSLTVVALAMVLLVLLALVPLELWLGGLPPVARGHPPSAGQLSGSRTVTAITAVYALFALGLPMLALAATALTRGPGLLPVPANWTLGNFRAGFAGGAGEALLRSVLLAFATAVLAPAVGGLAAGLARGRWRGVAAVAITVGYALPGSALAVGIMIGYGRWLTGSVLIIGVAYLAKLLAVGHRPLQAALDRLPGGLTAAARLVGAGRATAVRTVILPPLRPAAWAAGGLVFIAAFHELTMSTILYGPGSETFAVVIMNQQDLGGVGATAALSLVLTVPVLVVASLLAALARRPFRFPNGSSRL